MKLKLSQQIYKQSSNISSIKIGPVGAKLLHADGRTDGHDEANIRFLNFAKAHKIDPKEAASKNAKCTELISSTCRHTGESTEFQSQLAN
jgi:hypothetical protein